MAHLPSAGELGEVSANLKVVVPGGRSSWSIPPVSFPSSGVLLLSLDPFVLRKKEAYANRCLTFFILNR